MSGFNHIYHIYMWSKSKISAVLPATGKCGKSRPTLLPSLEYRWVLGIGLGFFAEMTQHFRSLTIIIKFKWPKVAGVWKRGDGTELQAG